MTGIDPYSASMQETMEYLKKHADYSVCNNCGGTGINAVMCCNGDMCGCRGMPVDFEFECKQCNRTFQKGKNSFPSFFIFKQKSSKRVWRVERKTRFLRVPSTHL